MRQFPLLIAAAAIVIASLFAVSNGVAEDGSKSKKGVRFDPVVQKIEGWTVHVDPALLEGEAKAEGAKALRMLGDHLHFISLLMDEERLKKLRTLEIWIERDHPTLKAMQYHPSGQWLSANGYDLRLTQKVHIPVAAHLLQRGQLLKHPMVVLHELAHAYHDQILDFGHPEIIAAYDKAKESGSYEKVMLFDGRTVRHYGLTNHKEYFAEGTEAYFNRNDFYPFVRGELKAHDPELHKVLEEVWGRL